MVSMLHRVWLASAPMGSRTCGSLTSVVERTVDFLSCICSHYRSQTVTCGRRTAAAIGWNGHMDDGLTEPNGGGETLKGWLPAGGILAAIAAASCCVIPFALSML